MQEYTATLTTRLNTIQKESKRGRILREQHIILLMII